MLLKNKFVKPHHYCFLLLLASIFMVGWSFPEGEKEVRDVALTFKTRGLVQIKRNGKTTWENGKRGFRLNSGDQVRTGKNSLAAVVFVDDKSLLKIRSQTEVTIRGERQQKSIAKRVFMQVGEVFVSVKRQKSTFRLETPTGVAAVKGTEFYGIVEEDGDMFIVAIKGIVELINKYGSILVNAGETGKASPNAPPEKEKTDPNQQPNWGEEEAPPESFDELEIEFKSEQGEIKKLKIKTKSKGK